MINYEDYLGIVEKVANKNRNYFYYDDLKQELTIKLYELTKTYDESKGTKFSTYAYKYLWGYSANYKRKNNKFVKTSKMEEWTEPASHYNLDDNNELLLKSYGFKIIKEYPWIAINKDKIVVNTVTMDKYKVADSGMFWIRDENNKSKGLSVNKLIKQYFGD